MKYFVLPFLFLSQLSFAQISTSPKYPTEGSSVVPEIVKPEKSPTEKVVDDAASASKDESGVATQVEDAVRGKWRTEDLRDDSIGTAMVGLQYISSWIPLKKTISYTHIFNKKWSLEGEYAFAGISFPVVGIDLGEIKEKRYSLQARRYSGNSFNFSFGILLNDFNARLGSDILDRYATEIKSSFRVQNVGLTGGLGNRWQWNNGFTLGIDWIRLNIPVAETKLDDKVLEDLSEEDSDDVKKVIRTFNRIPTFVLFGLNLGYTF